MFLLSVAPHNLFVIIWFSLCSAQRLCALCGSIYFAQRGENEKRTRKPKEYYLLSEAPHNLFVIIWFSLCSAQRLCALCGSIYFAQRELNEKRMRKPKDHFFTSSKA
jgi:hypothetical protein